MVINQKKETGKIPTKEPIRKEHNWLVIPIRFMIFPRNSGDQQRN